MGTFNMDIFTVIKKLSTGLFRINFLSAKCLILAVISIL